MSQVPAIILIKQAAYSMHASPHDLRGSDSPRTHQASPMAQIHTHQVLQTILHQIHAAWHDVLSLRRCGIARELLAFSPPTSAAALVPPTTCVGH